MVSILSSYIYGNTVISKALPQWRSHFLITLSAASRVTEISLANGTLAQAESLCIALSWASCPLLLPTVPTHRFKTLIQNSPSYLGLMHTMMHKYSYSHVCLSRIAALLANKEQCLLDIQANIQLLTHTSPYKHRASCWRQAGVGGSVPVLLLLWRPHRKSPGHFLLSQCSSRCPADVKICVTHLSRKGLFIVQPQQQLAVNCYVSYSLVKNTLAYLRNSTY